MTQRRRALKGLGALGVAGSLGGVAQAQPKTVNVGVILPLSGANAQFGINSRQGIEMVAGELNAAGGLAALGGAKINLVIADSTSTPANAATVAQRMIGENDCCAILGAFASTLSLAISEVTERRGIPLITMSYADQLTGRGFKNVFQVTPKGSVIGAAQFNYAAELAGGPGKVNKWPSCMRTRLTAPPRPRACAMRPRPLASRSSLTRLIRSALPRSRTEWQSGSIDTSWTWYAHCYLI